MLCAMTFLIVFKISSWYLLVLYVNFSVKCLKFAPKCLAYFGGHFCYHSNSKSRVNARPLHLGYCSNKLIRIVFFSLIGGPKSHQRLYPQIFYEMTTRVRFSLFNNVLPKQGSSGPILNVVRSPWSRMECVDHHGSPKRSHDQVTLPPAADLWYPIREIIIILDG